MTNTRRIISALALGSLLVVGAACGGSKDADKTEVTASTQPGERAPEDQKVMDELAEEVNVGEGERIEPGSIESKEVSGLSADCEKAIAPVRELTKKYKSGLLVPPNDTTIADVMKAANPDEGGACSYQEFADWYSGEFNGWNNAVAK
jgi:hypothetical protein